jgi:hypothetical protein
MKIDMTSYLDNIKELESIVDTIGMKAIRYLRALEEIASADATSHHVHHLTQIAQAALDGEPTTADELNTEYESGSDIVRKLHG